MFTQVSQPTRADDELVSQTFAAKTAAEGKKKKTKGRKENVRGDGYTCAVCGFSRGGIAGCNP